MQHSCLQCDNKYEGNFCPQCGQKSHTHRITFQAILHDIPHSVFHVDKGLLHTFLLMLYKPGTLVKNYVDGRRVKYFSPFAYVFLLSAISSYFTHLVAQHSQLGSAAQRMVFPQAAVFFAHYPALMLCLFTPFLSFWSWLFNRSSGYNYWENLILNTYLIAQFNLVFIIYRVAQLTHLYDSANLTPVILFFMAYITFAYHQFFRPKRTAGRALLNILMFLTIGFTFITMLSLAGFMTPWWGFWGHN